MLQRFSRRVPRGYGNPDFADRPWRLVNRGGLDVLDCVYGQGVVLALQFEPERVQDREDGGQAGERVGGRGGVRGRRRQPHGNPALSVQREQPGEGGVVDDGHVGPVADVVGEVVHIDGFSDERMAQAAGEAVATFRAGVQDAVLTNEGGRLQFRPCGSGGEGVDRHRFVLGVYDQAETVGEQGADHLLSSASRFAVRKAGSDGVGGRLRLNVVPLLNGPFGKSGETRRSVDRHIVGITQERDDGD